MSDAVLLKAEKRETKGSSEARRLRRSGGLPAVVCRKSGRSESVKLNQHDFEVMLHHHASEHLLVKLSVDGGAELNVLMQDVQHHPLTGLPQHIDFVEVSMDETIVVEIPVEFVGEPAGVKQGGVLDAVMHSLEVECLPGDLMEKIEVDVSALGINDMLNVGDVKLDPSKYTLITDGALGLVHVTPPRTEEEEAAEEGAEAATEPEVIGAADKEEEGEEAS
jgi:large subunit ribosomal protein L25